MPATIEVPIAPLPLERFRPLLGEGYAEIESAAARAQGLLAGRTVWHLNSTDRGGGVVELLRSLLAYAFGAGVSVRWRVITGPPEFFAVTKRIHNRLHGAPGDGGPLDGDARSIYTEALRRNAAELASLVGPDDVVVCHDPQTAGLMPELRRHATAVVWRCHVGVDTPNDLVREAWNFLRDWVDSADAYIFSRREFVWDGLDAGQVEISAPVIDAFSPKNQQLEPERCVAILHQARLLADGARAEPTFARLDGGEARVTHFAELDSARPLRLDDRIVCQVSRWDRLKDPLGVMRALAERLPEQDAHLVLAGPGAGTVSDDPESAAVLAEVRSARARCSQPLRERIHLASLPMADLEENAAIVNALQRHSEIIVQKSLAEGFGLTVAEAMWKRRPVVASRVGGIQDQIVDGESGKLVDANDLEEFAGAVSGLLADRPRARALGEAARTRVLEEFLGTAGLVRYLELLERLLG